MGISEGHLIGTADPSARLGASPTEIAFTAQEARIVSLPRGLDPVPFTCELRWPCSLSSVCASTPT